VYLYGQPADLRCSFDGLQALVRQGLREDPLNGGLYVFINRRGTQIRVLYFDRSGFCIWAKRLEAGRFISNWGAVHTRQMDWTGLKLLLEGIEPGRQRKRYRLISAPQNSAHAQSHSINSAHESARSSKLINDTS
jgi:transposase